MKTLTLVREEKCAEHKGGRGNMDYRLYLEGSVCRRALSCGCFEWCSNGAEYLNSFCVGPFEEITGIALKPGEKRVVKSITFEMEDAPVESDQGKGE